MQYLFLGLALREQDGVDVGQDTTGGDGNATEQLPKSEQEITDKILGKPSVKPAGPSHIKIHKPIPKCETQSYSDAFKTMAYLSGLVPAQYGRRASKSSRSVHDARRTAACALRGPLAARPAREHPLQLL